MRRLALLLVVLALSACGGESAPLPPWRGEDNLVEVTLDDIHCGGCEVEIEEALAAVEGVATVEADSVSRLVLVMLKKETDREAAIQALRAAIHGTGRKVVGEDPVD